MRSFLKCPESQLLIAGFCYAQPEHIFHIWRISPELLTFKIDQVEFNDAPYSRQSRKSSNDPQIYDRNRASASLGFRWSH